MQDFVPFQFDNFIEGEKSPVFDLSLNRPKDDNNLLTDINAKLQILLEDRNNQNIKLIKMVLAEIAPALAKNCSNEIINDFISRRFPDWAKQKVLDIYFNDMLAARGKLVLAGKELGISLTEILVDGGDL